MEVPCRVLKRLKDRRRKQWCPDQCGRAISRAQMRLRNGRRLRVAHHTNLLPDTAPLRANDLAPISLSPSRQMRPLHPILTGSKRSFRGSYSGAAQYNPERHVVVTMSRPFTRLPFGFTM